MNDDRDRMEREEASENTRAKQLQLQGRIRRWRDRLEWSGNLRTMRGMRGLVSD